MAAQRCPVCQNGVLERKTFVFETLLNNGRGGTKMLRVPDVKADVCSHCHETFADTASEARVVAAQRQALGLLSAAQIRQLRGKRTQAEMCELLGIGKKTYSRWESGSHFQSESFDRYLRLLMTVQENWTELERIAQAKNAEWPAEEPENAE